MSLQIYNTRSKTKELFKSHREGKVTMYVCGPTVYDLLHIGNFRGVVFFNVVRQWLENSGYEVTFALNYTDIDDKIIARAAEKNISPSELTDFYIQAYQDDLSLLALKPHDINPKCTDHIDDIITLISKLITDGFAYEIAGSVFFDVHSFKDYGKLSGKRLDDLEAGHRVDPHPDKRHPFDFVLWKPSKDHEPSWESPWGMGRPGWHIECSAMCHAHLGEQVDIHGGGIDLIFPHHENEIAQSCCNNSTQKFANYWVHNGFVTIDKEKMSKSLGNIVTISDAVKKYSGQVVRLALMSAHYSQPLDWNEKLLLEQKSTIEKWYQLYEDSDEEIETEVIESLLEDLNTPGFIAKIHELYNAAKKGNKKSKKNFNGACRLIGLFNLSKDEWDKFKKSNSNISEEFILNKINERLNAKNNGNYKLADQIRDELLKKDVVIEDQKDKTVWKFK